MNYHVFIVDSNTFKIHLEYMFAGTGASNKTVPFLSVKNNSYMHSTTERNLVGMIADVSRIRIGDKIIFYLQSFNNNPGMFFGVFKATSTAFFDENDNDNYLKTQLNKSLTFRVMIEPDTVYPLGVSEHLYLDSLNGIQYPFQMCWSLIYRKLKGNRGCTMITDYEFNHLVKQLQLLNNNQVYLTSCNYFTFNSNSYSIESSPKRNSYTGRTSSISVRDRLLFKAENHNAFEVHLQAYIMQQFDSYPLKRLILPFPDLPCWIGNEVSCGVGMQRIDIMIKQDFQNSIYLKIVELKCVEPTEYILEHQLPWYIQWVKEYVVPNYTLQGKQVFITPCIIALHTHNINFYNGITLFDYKNSLQNNNYLRINPLDYIAIDTSGNDINFEKVK